MEKTKETKETRKEKQSNRTQVPKHPGPKTRARNERPTAQLLGQAWPPCTATRVNIFSSLPGYNKGCHVEDPFIHDLDTIYAHEPQLKYIIGRRRVSTYHQVCNTSKERRHV